MIMCIKDKIITKLKNEGLLIIFLMGIINIYYENIYFL
tara:strand:- start:1545 stop:1658 length:114 start_codon:yes stop_codon:yes gene_type:complete